LPIFIDQTKVLKPRFLGIVLFCCLVIPLAATMLVLKIQRIQIRREVKMHLITSIHKDELVRLSFTSEQERAALRWEHAHEFEFEGKMYDLVSKQTNGDTTHYWCWPDKKETKLNRQIDQLIAAALSQNQHQSENETRLLKFFKSLFFLTEQENASLLVAMAPAEHFIFDPNFYPDSFRVPPYAPPEVL